MNDSERLRFPRRRPAIDWTLTPARIAGLYLAVGIGVLYVSDVLLPSVVTTQALLERLQLAKGFLEVGATAALIYAVSAGWRGSLSRANERLDAAREELSVLHRIVRHDLRNDVTVVAGHADTLGAAVDQPHLEDHCDAIRDSCEDLVGYSEKTKYVAALDPGDVETTTVDLAAVLDRVRDRLDPPPSDAELAVSIPDGAGVDAHEYVEFALLELVENALVHNDASEPAVTVTARDAPECPGWMQVCVEDNGPGIPEAERAAVQHEEEPLHHSSGVGLWVARCIVVQSGGDFEVENTPSGCRVTVTLPRPETTPAGQAEAALKRFLA